MIFFLSVFLLLWTTLSSAAENIQSSATGSMYESTFLSWCTSLYAWCKFWNQAWKLFGNKPCGNICNNSENLTKTTWLLREASRQKTSGKVEDILESHFQHQLESLFFGGGFMGHLGSCPGCHWKGRELLRNSHYYLIWWVFMCIHLNTIWRHLVIQFPFYHLPYFSAKREKVSFLTSCFDSCAALLPLYTILLVVLLCGWSVFVTSVKVAADAMYMYLIWKSFRRSKFCFWCNLVAV